MKTCREHKRIGSRLRRSQEKTNGFVRAYGAHGGKGDKMLWDEDVKREQTGLFALVSLAGNWIGVEGEG